MGRSIKPGDCFEIPLPAGKRAYCQFLMMGKYGPLLKVFNRIDSASSIEAESLQHTDELFPPVFAGLHASVRRGRWRFIGTFPVAPFRFPTFRNSFTMAHGENDDWWLWDGEKDRFIGRLPVSLRSLELKVTWGDELLEDRIASGDNPFANIV
jgi:hypothetical protein